VDALADIDRNMRLARVGIFLALKRLDMPRTVDAVVNDPGFLGFSNPLPFANRHIPIPVGNMSQYVAVQSASQQKPLRALRAPLSAKAAPAYSKPTSRNANPTHTMTAAIKIPSVA
jgi:hypothetical protein